MLNEPLDERASDELEEAAPHDEGGFVLPWMALMLIVLIAMAGFGVDVWNWWYTSQKVQRAADAGALAGVPFMPNLDSGVTPNATTTAVGVVQQNGFGSATVAEGDKSNQIVVTVSTTVNNYFVSLLGLQTTSITRSATAEFNAPVQMGSPAGHLGNDPENGATDKHWLNIGAPGVDKHTGDRFADYSPCGSNSYGCSGGNNSEYLDDTYTYTVDVASPVPAQGIDIQAYDPEYADGNQNCDNQWLSSAQVGQLQSANSTQFGIDAPTRYNATGRNDYCTGDDNTNLSSPANGQATAWIVRSGVSTSYQVGNAIGGCSKQFKAYVPTSSTYWYDLLNPATQDIDFYNSFHRWYTLCHVTAPGRYFIQVRSSVPYGGSDLLKSESPPENASLAGQNRYSLRLRDTGTGLEASGNSVYALSRLPVYTNTTSVSTPNFYLARLLPGGGSNGRILQLEFYDIGDVGGGSTSLTVSPPADALPANSISCSQWVFNGATGNSAPSGTTFSNNNCTVSGITSADYSGGYNGVLVDVKVNVPGNYTCGNGLTGGVNNSQACWFKIQMSYSSGAQANDTTTWSASIGGDPVRLVK